MTALKQKLLELIGTQGPITVAQFMQLSLSDPEHGYYMRSNPLGRDFITAPEVSQIFGELIGLFLVQTWEDSGAPARFDLVELGPGRGTLMADALRAASVRPGFITAAQITLVETSPALRRLQARTLASHQVRWVDRFEDLRDEIPLFLVANEFFDALPIRQFVKSAKGWHERMVSAEADMLRFTATPDPVPSAIIPARLAQAEAGAVFEYNPAATAAARQIGERVAMTGGVALAIDYGHGASGTGDTLQAVQEHRYVDILAAPGEADLTAHVDFALLGQAARSAGAEVFGPVTQGQFLEDLGIRLRAQSLKQKSPEHAADIDAGVERLTGPEEMGTLFKVAAIAGPNIESLPGFL